MDYKYIYNYNYIHRVISTHDRISKIIIIDHHPSSSDTSRPQPDRRAGGHLAERRKESRFEEKGI